MPLRLGRGSRGTLLLSRSLLADATGAPHLAAELAPLFAASWLSRAPRSGFTIPVDAIRYWAATRCLQWPALC